MRCVKRVSATEQTQEQNQNCRALRLMSRYKRTHSQYGRLKDMTKAIPAINRRPWDIAYRTRGGGARAVMRADVVLQMRFTHERHATAGDRTRKGALARVRLVVPLQVALQSGEWQHARGCKTKVGRVRVERYKYVHSHQWETQAETGTCGGGGGGGRTSERQDCGFEVRTFSANRRSHDGCGHRNGRSPCLFTFQQCATRDKLVRKMTPRKMGRTCATYNVCAQVANQRGSFAKQSVAFDES